MRPSLRSSLLAVGIALSALGCAEAPAVVGDDPQLETGRDVWIARCATCHGADGAGGSGPALHDGRVVDAYPDPADQAELIRSGKGRMPSFETVLDDEQIVAVIRYTREVLD